METKQKRAAAEKVRRELSRRLEAHGYARGKPTYWIRPGGDDVIEFIHLHLYSFAPAFRVHCGVRVLDSSFDAIDLNGLYADEIRTDAGRARSFEFAEDEASRATCAEAIADFCTSAVEAWFSRLRPHEALLGPDSPLHERDAKALREALRGHHDPEAIQRSRRLLGAT